MSFVRTPLVDVGRGVQFPDELLVSVVPLSPVGEATERPGRDRERERQEQQSGREPQSSARCGPYRLPPPLTPCTPASGTTSSESQTDVATARAGSAVCETLTRGGVMVSGWLVAGRPLKASSARQT
jgi:hypothetical protein